MKKAGILLKAGFVAIAALAFNSAAYSQAAEVKPGKQSGATITQPAANQMRGNTMTAVDSKLLLQKQSEVKPVVISTNAERNCVSKSTMKPYSITRANFNNLPSDRQQFVLSNSDKYTIVD